MSSPHPLQLFSAAKPSSSPSAISSSVKLKSLINSLIVSHMCRIIRALSKVKAAIVQTLKGDQSSFLYHRSRNVAKNIVFGSFRLHYNWCSSKSSHVIPVPSRVFQGFPETTHTDEDLDLYHCHDDDSQLAGYLQWLEDGNGVNEIDVLAEMFIAQCHEKFKLEKQESDRRFHDMLLRGM